MSNLNNKISIHILTSYKKKELQFPENTYSNLRDSLS